ncbi:MAG TPA: OB-fold nucleic acid binding domain-containing protein, partial [Dehalococcoidia bacterium]|nr:OB-fold nucleic acid binding domain-containing protein [Dehalococcoidia bacterium]
KNFIAGANKKGISTELAKEVFSLIEPFAGYAFNKAHSVSYALIAYRGAYLKANYPTEYMTALLNTYWDDMEKVRSAVAECRRLGIQVLAPDINKSQVNFAIREEDGNSPAICFGLAAIKNVGPSPIECILSARRQGGVFKSIEDFCHRVDLRNINKKVLESLIKAGAFDSLGSRGALLESISKIVSLAQTEQRMKESGQVSMFDLTSPVFVLVPEIKKGEDVSIKQKLDWERELLGVYFSSSPLDSLAQSLRAERSNLISCGEISTDMANETVVTAGMVASVRQAYTRDRRPFIVATIEDLNGGIETIVWPGLYENTKELWQEGNILLVNGLVKVRDGRVQLNCQQAQRYQPQDTPSPSKGGGESEGRHLIINLNQTGNAEEDIECLRKVIGILQSYPGHDTVSLSIMGGDEPTNLDMPEVTINYCPELASELSNILGKGILRLEQRLM